MSSTDNLLGLEDLILHQILDFLDTRSLRNLRLVCRALKILVENPCQISKLQIYFGNENYEYPCYSFYDGFLESTVKWNNFALTTAMFSKQEDAIKVHLARSRVLKIMTPQLSCGQEAMELSDIVRLLLAVGPNLEKITFIGSLSLGKEVDPQSALRKMKALVEESTAILEQKLHNLRQVIFQWDFVFADENICALALLFDIFLKFCPNLVELSTSLMSSLGTASVSPNSVDALRKNYQDGNCQPLLSYVERIKENNKIPNLRKIDLGFFVFHRHLFWYRNPMSAWIPEIQVPHLSNCSSPFALNPASLTKLVRLCASTDIKLHNVPLSSLPNKKNLSESDKRCFDKCLINLTLICLGAPTLDLTYLQTTYIPPKCPIQVFLWWRDESDSDYSAFYLPEFLSIVKICLFGLGHERPVPASLLLNLFQTHRSSVTSLNVYCCNPVIERLGPRLSSCFPNLNKLELFSAHGKAKISVHELLSGLRELEDVILNLKFPVQNVCRSVFEQGFSSLKKLKNMQFKYPFHVNITD